MFTNSVTPQPLTERVATFLEKHKTAVLIASGTAVVASVAGFYLLKASKPEKTSEESSEKKKSKKGKGKAKRDSEKVEEKSDDEDHHGKSIQPWTHSRYNSN